MIPGIGALTILRGPGIFDELVARFDRLCIGVAEAA